MHTPIFQNFTVWRKSQQKKLWTKWTCFNPDFGKIDEFGWWDLEKILADTGTQFTLKEFKEECQTCGVRLMLAAPEHQDMNRQVEVKWRRFCTVAHSLMVHGRVLEAYVHFSLMYMIDHIVPVLRIKYLINEDGDSTTPHKLATGTKPSVSHLRVLFFSMCCTESYGAR